MWLQDTLCPYKFILGKKCLFWNSVENLQYQQIWIFIFLLNKKVKNRDNLADNGVMNSREEKCLLIAHFCRFLSRARASGGWTLLLIIPEPPQFNFKMHEASLPCQWEPRCSTNLLTAKLLCTIDAVNAYFCEVLPRQPRSRAGRASAGSSAVVKHPQRKSFHYLRGVCVSFFFFFF